MTNSKVERIFKNVEKKKVKTIEELHQESEKLLREMHKAYKNGEITFSELAPAIEEYRKIFERYQKETGQLGI